ncbi:MAG: hypothetical protein IPJ74_25970 [Saprospiraceae bacterium]|nr:hypothetical protein [Saprospiraceae bacterium]
MRPLKCLKICNHGKRVGSSRWIKHFCAPIFVFLAGTAAFLYGEKIKDKAALSRFLISRGIWLIIIELLIVNISWSLTLPHLAGFVFVQGYGQLVGR